MFTVQHPKTHNPHPWFNLCPISPIQIFNFIPESRFSMITRLHTKIKLGLEPYLSWLEFDSMNSTNAQRLLYQFFALTLVSGSMSS